MLLIEKVIKLLDDFHFQVYRNYVNNINSRSYYPLTLIDKIDRNIEKKQDSTWLFRETYGDDLVNEKNMKKFFQLAHYTFNLTAFLSKNFPNYLQHNILKIQQLINDGELAKATQLIGILHSVCEKIEDHDTELQLLNIIIQKNVLLEVARANQKHHIQIRKLLLYKTQLNDIFEHLHLHFRAKSKTSHNINLDKHLDFFAQFHQSDSFGVSNISRFCTCFVLYYTRDERFYLNGTYEDLLKLEKGLRKYNYIILPYLFTIGHRVSLLKLHHKIRELETHKILEEASNITSESQDILFWNSFVNLPEFFSIAVQSSYYVSNYLTSYQDNHLDLLPSEVSDTLANLKLRCEKLLANPLLEEKFTVKYINLTTFYSGFLLLGNKQEIKKSITMLEGLFILYQQIPFHSFIDSIYATIILAAFCLQDFDKIDDSYKRYKKATTGKMVNPENDLTIQGIYYAAKYIRYQRKQYIKKLSNLLAELDTPRYETTKRTMLSIISYYNIPIY